MERSSPLSGDDARPSLGMRWWLGAPDWAFRLVGATFFLVYFSSRARVYWENPFWEIGPYCIFPNGHRIPMPWVLVLTDITFLQIALAFCFRIQARMRASSGWMIAYSLLTAFAPLIPIAIGSLVGLWSAQWQESYNEFLWRPSISWQLALAYGVVMTTGLSLEVWGYAVLFRSLSIVPEARELKVTGPYRFVRHPIYLGQFIAQGGFLLIAARTHWLWISLYVLFVAMQLYRSKLEDRVLAAAFGGPYREWQRRTFWFV